jgi:hypothetical protein
VSQHDHAVAPLTLCTDVGLGGRRVPGRSHAGQAPKCAWRRDYSSSEPSSLRLLTKCSAPHARHFTLDFLIVLNAVGA